VAAAKRPPASGGNVLWAGIAMIVFQVVVAAAVMASLCVMTVNDVRRHG
jgi:hypothetical protein